MNTFKQHLEESMNKAYKWKRVDRDKYFFEVESDEVEVVFSHSTEGKNSKWVAFTVNGRVERPRYYLTFDMKSELNMTMMYKTVLDIVHDYIKRNPNIDSLLISAMNSKQDKIYHRMINRFLPSDWSMTVEKKYDSIQLRRDI